jgi:osmoprotectant transport system substrate-binding protein
VALGLTLVVVAGACGSSKKSSSTTTAASSGASSSAPTTAAGAATTAGATTTAAPAAAVFSFKPIDSGPLRYAALKSGDAQLAAVFTSDGAIAANDLVVLDDDKGLQPVQNLVPIGRADKMTDAVTQVVNEAFAALTTDDLSNLNKQVDIDKKDPADVAKAWIASKGLNKSDPSLSGKFTVGSANFTEQFIVAEIMAQVLQAHGMDVSKKLNIGARELVAPALEKGDIDGYVEYVGAYLNYLGGTPSSDLNASLQSLQDLASKKNITVLDASPANDEDGLAVTQATASKYNLKSISDLAKVPDKLVFVGPSECPKRDFCILGYEKVYGLRFNV